jgi:LCP family protein required for cell wall assembly
MIQPDLKNEERKRKGNKPKKVIGAIGIFLIILGIILFIVFWQSPMSENLDLSSIPIRPAPSLPQPTGSFDLLDPTGTPFSPETEITPEVVDSKDLPEPTSTRSAPLCGNQSDWIVLLAGLDYEKPDPGYLYGLADVIRLIHVDFTIPRVNVVSLPRALLVDIIPEHYSIPGPLLINQGYFFGARGMGDYTGDGYGAGSLAEVIKFNFGINTDHYLVVNFGAFVNFIDAIGGIDVDLPTYVDDRPRGYFPPGIQHLDGERTLYLARIRQKYSDLVRINDQSYIIKAIFQRLKDPYLLTHIPELYDALKNSVITDVSPSQIENAYCLFKKMSGSDLHFFDPGWDNMNYGRVYIPTVGKEMEIFFWDQTFIDWINNSLWSE